MSKYVDVEINLEDFEDECIEMLEGKGYKVFEDNSEIQEYCAEWDVNYNQAYDSILGYLEEMKNKVYYENVSDDYKKAYEDLDRIVFYEGE
jgi:hypothetical protein